MLQERYHNYLELQSPYLKQFDYLLQQRLTQLLCCCVFLLLCNVARLQFGYIRLLSFQSAGLVDLLMTNTETDLLERGGIGGG